MERVRLIRDPYGDFGFKEMEKLLRKVQADLDEKVAEKEFVRAAELEADM